MIAGCEAAATNPAVKEGAVASPSNVNKAPSVSSHTVEFISSVLINPSASFINTLLSTPASKFALNLSVIIVPLALILPEAVMCVKLSNCLTEFTEPEP